ncbi:MAG: chorismate synthase [Acidobacteriota bacterium]
MNSFGRVFRISIYGESHGWGVGCLIDGCPPGLALSVSEFQEDLERRRSHAAGTTKRQEKDIPLIRSGVFEGKTTGAPLHIAFENKEKRSEDYENIRYLPRPGHADFTAAKKFFGFNDYRGGGQFSGRMTVALVAAGVIAKKIISPVRVNAGVIEAGGTAEVKKAVREAVESNDSIGGIIECVATKMPAGLGEPFFDSVESLISHLVFSIPGVRGIEFGSGFSSARMKGSVHNDPIINVKGETSTNHSGGINGGLTNGNPLVFRVAVKPASSIPKPQKTINLLSGEIDNLAIKGRHDSCFALRTPVIVEAATASVLADLVLTQRTWERKLEED